jgi:IclR family transcriptional regulator, acetate operon repressor
MDTASNKEDSTTSSVRAVDRALAILGAFTALDRDLSAAQLLSRVELSRPTLYRLLYSLERSGHIVSHTTPMSDTLRFSLGPAVAGIAQAWAAKQDLTTIAEPFMQKLWEQSQETVSLFVRQQSYRLCVAELPSPQALSFKRGIGYREKMSVGASGQVMLAFSQEAVQTLADRTAYKSIRTRGYAVSNGALIQGATAIAAPIFNRHLPDGSGIVCASLAVFGPSTRLHGAKIEQLAARLIKATQAISRSL